MTNKQLLTAVEGKHHDRKPPYSRAKARSLMEVEMAQRDLDEAEMRLANLSEKVADAANYVQSCQRRLDQCRNDTSK